MRPFFIDAWSRVLSRYLDNKTVVVGVDIFNEDQRTDTQAHNDIFRRIVVELEKRYPNRFIWMVGGTHWSGVLAGVDLEDLPFSDRIRYTAHRYPFANSSAIEAELDYVLGSHQGETCGGAFNNKINIGEWSSSGNHVWSDRFIAHLKTRGIYDNFHWTIANSGDTANLWRDDCVTLNMDEVNTVKSLWSNHSNLRLQV